MHNIIILETPQNATTLILNKELDLLRLNLGVTSKYDDNKEYANVVMCCIANERVTSSNCLIQIEGHDEIRRCIGFSDTGDVECDNGLCYDYTKCKPIIALHGCPVLSYQYNIKGIELKFVLNWVSRYNSRNEISKFSIHDKLDFLMNKEIHNSTLDNVINLTSKVNDEICDNVVNTITHYSKEQVEQLCRDAWQVGYNVGYHDETSPSGLTADDWVKSNL